MTRQARAVLRNLQKLTKRSEDEVAFLGNTCCFALTADLDATWDYSKYNSEIYGIIRWLAQGGYIAYTRNEYHFQLTHHGLHPYRFAFEEVRNFLIKSVLIPIAVSFFTTLITLWITEWW